MLPTPPDTIAVLLQRPVAVFGAGVSGQGVLTLLAGMGVAAKLYDEHADGAETIFSARQAAEHGLVVFSPGFAPEHLWLATARGAGCLCLGELDFASLFWSGELIAVTGTNGKTTLAEFLAHALNAAGRKAAVTGNVGYPFSRLVADQAAIGTEAEAGRRPQSNPPESRPMTAVCEISSFQAETLRHLRPTAMLWTNFAEDHLERHSGMDAYFAAKWRLLERTAPEAVFVGSSVQAHAVRFGRTPPASACIASEGRQADARLEGTVFASYPQLENFLLAAAWWRRAELPEASLYAAARTFRLGRHRLTRVRERGGVTYWNDSKATNFHAVEAALAGFRSPVLWIGGGRSKGGDIAGFVRRIAPGIRHAFLIGETQPELARHFRAAGVAATACGSLAEAVAGAAARAADGDQVLLSPGFASFDMFRGYEDRGRQFEILVEKM